MIINNNTQGDIAMPRELEQPMTVDSPDAAISALLCLLHSYATQTGEQSSPRIGQRIYHHLEGLAQREDLPEVLHQTCDELSDAWQSMLDIKVARL
jgi:hypothetical protein